MELRIKLAPLYLLFFIALFGYAVADAEKEILLKARSAPHKNVGSSILDGSGSEDAFNSESSDERLVERKGGNSRVSVSTVAFCTLVMAAATGLGALPFFFVELDPQWAGICNGMAAGVMLAASFDLIQEGQDHGSGNWVVIGILAGGIFIWICKKVIIFTFSKSVNYLQTCSFSNSELVNMQEIMSLYDNHQALIPRVGVSYLDPKQKVALDH